MRTIRTLTAVALALGTWVPAAGAATLETGVAGLKLLLLDNYALGKAKAVYVAKGNAGIQKGPAADPPGLTGMVEIFPLSDPSNKGSYSLAGPWLVNKDTVAKYVNQTAAPGSLGAQVLVVKPGLVGKLVAKNLGDGDGASGDQGANDLDLLAIQDTDTIRAVVTVNNSNDGNTYVFCSDFSALSIKKDDADVNFKVLSKTSTAPATCSVAPPSATTTTTTTPTTTSSTTTTTIITGSALSLLEAAAGGVPTGIASVEVFLASPFSTGYLNVVIDLDRNGPDPGTDPAQGGDWWVQNRPLVIDAGSGGVSFTFPLGTINPSGSYDVYASFTATAVTTPSLGDMVLTSQVPFGMYDTSGLMSPPDGLYHGLGPVTSSQGVGATYRSAAAKWLHRGLDEVSAWVEGRAHAQLPDIDGQLRFDIPGIQQGYNDCGPGAAAQSLLWFADTQGFFLPPPDNLVTQLKYAMQPLWVGGPYPGVDSDGFLAGKNTVVQALGLPIETTVWEYDGSSDAFDFIRTEMQANADVEVFLRNAAGVRHIATVAGWVQVVTDAGKLQGICVNDPFFGGKMDCYSVSLSNWLENYKIAGTLEMHQVVSERLVPPTTTTTTVTSTTLPGGGSCGHCGDACDCGAGVTGFCWARHSSDCLALGGDLCWAPGGFPAGSCTTDADCPPKPGCGGTCNYACGDGNCYVVCPVAQ